MTSTASQKFQKIIDDHKLEEKTDAELLSWQAGWKENTQEHAAAQHVMQKRIEGDKQEENIHQEFRFYRTSGITLSATVITFGTVLLGWAINNPFEGFVYILQLLLTIAAIILGFFIQYFQFQGYKNQANARFEKSRGRNDDYNTLMENANYWFELLDKSVGWSMIFIGFSFTLLVFLWFSNEYI